jgi:hypothetical protein
MGIGSFAKGRQILFFGFRRRNPLRRHLTEHLENLISRQYCRVLACAEEHPQSTLTLARVCASIVTRICALRLGVGWSCVSLGCRSRVPAPWTLSTATSRCKMWHALILQYRLGRTRTHRQEAALRRMPGIYQNYLPVESRSENSRESTRAVWIRSQGWSSPARAGLTPSALQARTCRFGLRLPDSRDRPFTRPGVGQSRQCSAHPP